MTGHVYRLSASFELPLEELHDYLENPDLHEEVESIELTRRNRKLLIQAVAADKSLSKYTPTAQLKASVEEKRVYEEDPEQGNHQWKRPQDEEEIPSELVDFATFKGDLEAVLQNSALRYPMFQLLRNIALHTEMDGALTAITAEDGVLYPTKIVDGEERPATIQVVEDSQTDHGRSGDGVSW